MAVLATAVHHDPAATAAGAAAADGKQSAGGVDEMEQEAASLQPVIRFLQSALLMHSKGDSLHYDHLVHQLTIRDDTETLWRLYLGLTRCVTTICERYKSCFGCTPLVPLNLTALPHADRTVTVFYTLAAALSGLMITSS